MASAQLVLDFRSPSKVSIYIGLCILYLGFKIELDFFFWPHGNDGGFI